MISLGSFAGLHWPKRVPRHAYVDRILTVARLTLTLSKGVCRSQPHCVCVSGKGRCHAAKRYGALMTPVAQHLYKTGEYNHDRK
jgi:hypothetical protein